MIAYLNILKSIADGRFEASAGSLAETSPAAATAEHLRLAMAVRGWTDPHSLAPQVSEETLEALAPDVETNIVHPGKWRLRDAVRRRTLQAASPAELEAALEPSPGNDDDPLRKALKARRDPSADAIDRLDEDGLSALLASLAWAPDFEGYGDPQLLRERVAALLARRRRDADIARITAAPFFGREGELDQLVEFATAPAAVLEAGNSLPVRRYIYVWGVGGAGKSTLFAHLERRFQGLPAPPLLVHIDCDQPGFDPADPVALVTTLFRQMSLVVSPEEAKTLRERSRQLAGAAQDAIVSLGERIGAHRGQAAKLAARRSLTLEAAPSFESLESVATETQSVLQSVVFDALRRVCASGRPLVLLIDTAELIFARGSEDVSVLRDWFETIGGSMGVADLRVILAGRTPAAALGPQTLATSLSDFWSVSPPIELADLDERNAVAMLQALGVDDPKIAAMTAQVLPRSPLVLRIAAGVWENDAERPGFVDAISRGKVDGAVAARYLTERVVRHLSSVAARPYVLAACVPPFVTRDILDAVVAPVVDDAPGPVSAEAVYSGLAAAGWLTRIDLSTDQISFHPEVRRLILSMMRANPEQAALIEKVRRAGLAYHNGKSNDADRTLASYYAEMIGEKLPRGDGRTLSASTLGAALEDLSEAARARLFNTEASPEGVEGFESDAQWRLRLEGDGKTEGEGGRLVRRARAAEALALYRRRPTRPDGLPPTFVIQALADDAQWDAEDVDIAAAIDALAIEFAEGDRAARQIIHGRLYWLTRLALLARPGPLSEPHRRLLQEAVAGINVNGPLLLLPSILAVAEAFSPERGPITPPAWLEARGVIETQVRAYLTHRLLFGFKGTFRPNVEALFVAQPDWPARFNKLLEAEGGFNQRLLLLPFERVEDLASFNKRLSELRDERVEIGPRADPAETILLLRGETTEFHRPLRAAIKRWLEAEPSSRTELVAIARETLLGMAFRTREFGEEFEARMERDLFGAWTILVPFADRARRLPRMFRLLSQVDAPTEARGMVVRVARAFLAWDAALCAGATSDWSAEAQGGAPVRDEGIQPRYRELGEEGA
ncbi:hypothetical protein [uncultured Rhodoblastus sp.]|uniref:hypothetical protein n=1 Tax=uncultured Rhodoblastus sp. TaxID=543037 RepID=UPI0025EE13BA|nr:hypothetical protein [uncultured Rhodoblastus sp.]